jgi:hypothetical protein
MAPISFICDYALIDPMTLIYRVDNVGAEVFATCEDIDEDCFRLDVFPLGEVFGDEDFLKVANAVGDYLFKD